MVILRGAATGRQVLSYAATHHTGNGPASPTAWQCFRISGISSSNAFECISPPAAENNPRDRIQLRYPQ